MNDPIHAKIICILLSFCLLSGILFSGPPVQAASSPEIVGIRTVAELEKYGTSITGYLREQVSRYSTEIDISSYRLPYTDENLDLLSDYIFYQLPEAFPVSNLQFSGRSGIVQSVKPVYSIQKDEYLSLLSACSTVADAMLADIKNNSSLTDVEKILLVHDRLALHTAYDDRVFNYFGSPEESKNITGTLLKGLAQCQGYSMSYIFLLQKLGVECCTTLSEKCGHMWNIVFVNGKPYHVDVTFDDPYFDLTGRVCHDHFLLSTAKLRERDPDRRNASDFDTTPTDTAFDNAGYTNSTAGFCLLDGILYYTDTSGNVRRADTQDSIFSKNAVWKASATSEWTDTYYHLCAAGNRLYFSDSTTVWRIDPASKEAEIFYTPTELLQAHKYYSIFGFDIRDGILLYDFYNSTDFYGVPKDSYHYEIPMDSISDDWRNVGTVEPEPPAAVYGDVDGDQTVTAADARLTLRYSVSLETFTGDQFSAADVDGDSSVSSADARLILRYSVKLETAFPVEEQKQTTFAVPMLSYSTPRSA